jgi:nucleosome binding factor SPN SPT16 subunit
MTSQVGEVNTDLSKRQNLHDRDEIEAEQQERLLKKKLTEAFKNFYKKAGIIKWLGIQILINV